MWYRNSFCDLDQSICRDYVNVVFCILSMMTIFLQLQIMPTILWEQERNSIHSTIFFLHSRSSSSESLPIVRAYKHIPVAVRHHSPGAYVKGIVNISWIFQLYSCKFAIFWSKRFCGNYFLRNLVLFCLQRGSFSRSSSLMSSDILSEYSKIILSLSFRL